MHRLHTSLPPRVRRHLLWPSLLVAASLMFSLGLACATPLAAFAAAVALTSSRRDALVLILSVWFANQFVGFTLLGYPWTASAFAWGVALGASAVLAMLAGQWTASRSVGAARVVGFLATGLAAFAAYEAALFVVAVTLLWRNRGFHSGDPWLDFRHQRRGLCRPRRTPSPRSICRARRRPGGPRPHNGGARVIWWILVGTVRSRSDAPHPDNVLRFIRRSSPTSPMPSGTRTRACRRRRWSSRRSATTGRSTRRRKSAAGSTSISRHRLPLNGPAPAPGPASNPAANRMATLSGLARAGAAA